MSSNKSYVYIIRSGEKTNSPVKVGVSDDVHGRLKQLQTGNPIQLHLISHFECRDRHHAFLLEKTIHESLSGQRLCGEWFSVSKRCGPMKVLSRIMNRDDIESISSDMDMLEDISRGGRLEKLDKLKATIASRDAEIERLKLAIEKGKLKRGVYTAELVRLGVTRRQIKSLHE